MADESIISSPRKLNSSIHRSRLHRKHKRLNATFTKTSEPPPNNATTSHSTQITMHEEDLSCTLLVMYDSEEENIKEECLPTVSSILKEHENYDPFAEQRLLVLADRFAAPPRNSPNFQVTQGFQPCNNFLNQSSKTCSEKSNTFYSTKKEEVEITDSELLQLCVETEQSTKAYADNIKQESSEVNQPSNSPTTPVSQQKPKSIVDLILEDFCSSPASPELKQSSDESNFHFRFANKTLRTYSRRKNSSISARQNIAVQYEGAANGSVPYRIDDDLISNGSSTDLSVQEDQTQIAFRTDVEELVELQHSQSLCENLQNLSAYFTELSGEEDRKEKIPLSTEQQQLASSECKELFEITVDNSSGIYNTTTKEEICNLQEDEGQFPTRNCGTISRDNTLEDEEKELVLAETPVQYANSPNGNISNEEDFRGFESEEEEKEARPVKETLSKQDCDKMILHDDDANSLTDNDDWYDECDIFANLDMDAALDATTSYKIEKEKSIALKAIENVEYSKVAELNVEPMLGFRTASNKNIKISADAQAQACAILQDLPQLSSSYIAEQDMEVDENEDGTKNMNRTFSISDDDRNSTLKQQQQWQYPNASPSLNKKYNGYQAKEKEMPTFIGFTTASSKKITISKEAETKAAKILEQLPPLSPSEEVNLANDTSVSSAHKEEQIFKGFRTASSKEIKISKEAQQQAKKLLEQLPDLEVEVEPDMHKVQGFRTASRKAIQVSEEAKKRATLIMEEVMNFKTEYVQNNAKECLDNIQFSEWPMVEEVQTEDGRSKIDAKTSDMNSGSNANLPGFATASNKTIKISEAAKQRAAAILVNLPELPADEVIKCKNTKTSTNTESVQNVVFSEWPLDDGVACEANEHEPPSNATHKRKRNESDFAANVDEPARAYSPHTPKFICTSPGKERSPLAHIQTTVARSSLSELAIKTPPDYRASHGVISRKNLLSLNKRNKLSSKSLHQSNEIKDDCSAVATPTNRRKRRSITSPPVTPIPNLQEFFQSATMSTSTPHPPAREQVQMRTTRARKRAELQAATLTSSTADTSLKRIEWENESLNKTATSLNASRLSNSSFSNIIKMESNPTPKQRIERLRMYGKPPSVSPILMSSTNNCRISGLKRRTRRANNVEQQVDKE